MMPIFFHASSIPKAFHSVASTMTILPFQSCCDEWPADSLYPNPHQTLRFILHQALAFLSASAIPHTSGSKTHSLLPFIATIDDTRLDIGVLYTHTCPHKDIFDFLLLIFERCI